MPFTYTKIFQNIYNQLISCTQGCVNIILDVDRMCKIRPYDHYKTWTATINIYNDKLTKENNIRQLLLQLLKLDIIYDFADGHKPRKKINNLTDNYYENGIEILNKLIDCISNQGGIRIDKFLIKVCQGININPGQTGIILKQILLQLFKIKNDKIDCLIEECESLGVKMILTEYLNPNNSPTIHESICLLNRENIKTILAFDHKTNRTKFYCQLLQLTDNDIELLAIDLETSFERWLHCKTIQQSAELIKWLQQLPMRERFYILYDWSVNQQLIPLNNNK